MARKPRRVVGVAGSLRRASYNRTLLEAARPLAPDGMEIQAHPLADVPLYDADEDRDDKPDGVLRLKRAIDGSDGVLLVTPEYNYGLPGVMKNAIDWASRPAYESPLRDKPVAIMSASPAATGGARAQEILKQALLGTASAVLPWPAVTIGGCADKLESPDRLIDHKGREVVTRYLTAFLDWIDAVSTFGANTERVG